MKATVADKYLGVTIELVNIVGVKPAPWLSFRPNIRIPNIEGIFENGFVVTNLFRQDECLAIFGRPSGV